METPNLETERLILKRGKYEDYVKVYEYDLTRLRNINGEFEFVKYNPENLIGWENIADEEDKCIDFIIFLKDTNEPIGNLVYDRYDESNNSLEISCNLHPNFWGKGYMKEAILKSMNHIFDNESIDNIIYGYAEENFKSEILSNKIEFEYYNDRIEYYKRIDKSVKEIINIMTKERFTELYKNKKII